MASQAEQLKALGTVIVADTGDLQAIIKYKPTDATTNPSLILKAFNQMKSDDEKKNEPYVNLIKLAIKYAKENIGKKDEKNTEAILALAVDRLSCEFGRKILEIVPGYVSTELDARLSFDIDGCIERATRIMNIYESIGVKNPQERVLIKIASTWEGMQAAKILKEKFNIKTNMTLLFSIWQAGAAAHIGHAFLISPFVGRITDWHKKAKNVNDFKPSEDPGVISVQQIYHYYKKHNVNTIVMGASFRSKAQIIEIAGVDRCTISPDLLEQLQGSQDKIEKKLPNEKLIEQAPDKLDVNEKSFRWNMNQDACATEKLAEGIRKFAEDTVAVEEILTKFL